MINSKIVTCGLCQNYYADPRQIPCSHSFCYDCISGRFNENTLTLVCPKCEKLHEYQSLVEFHNRCMRDSFLATMVAQFKRSQSRLSSNSSQSRPPSSFSLHSAISPSTARQRSGLFETESTNLDLPNLDRSTPRLISQQKSPSVSQQSTMPASRSIFAKCQSCNQRAELVVCEHCDNVVCFKCRNEHGNVINADVKREWELCKTHYETTSKQSYLFDINEKQANDVARNLQSCISKQGDKLIQAIENKKNKYINIIEKHLQAYKQCCVQEQVVDEYESIDKRIEELLKSDDITPDKINDFLFEIEHLENRLDDLHKNLDSNPLKFPLLTLPEQINISALFGTLQFVDLNAKPFLSDPYSCPTTNGSTLHDKSDDEDYIVVSSADSYRSKTSSINSIEPTEPLESLSNIPKKKLLWQIDYFSVPYYVRIYEDQLFVCDKYGSLAVYQLNKPNDVRQKPTACREIHLFRDSSTPGTIDDDQTIIDSFAVSKLWIIVFKRKRNELYGAIYLFTHEGKRIQKGKCVHNYPSRELTMDTEKHILWSLDQKQLCLFYYDLPDVQPNDFDEYFNNRHSHVQLSKPFAPIHMSVNKKALAVLDKNRQAVHVYDKKTRQQLYEYVNINGNSTHFCWDMALFSDNSLLIKLDEMSSLKTGSSKHIYFQLDVTNKHNIVAAIEETDAYGMLINTTDEILIGVRINTKGIIKCYV